MGAADSRRMAGFRTSTRRRSARAPGSAPQPTMVKRVSESEWCVRGTWCMKVLLRRVCYSHRARDERAEIRRFPVRNGVVSVPHRCGGTAASAQHVAAMKTLPAPRRARLDVSPGRNRATYRLPIKRHELPATLASTRGVGRPQAGVHERGERCAQAASRQRHRAERHAHRAAERPRGALHTRRDGVSAVQTRTARSAHDRPRRRLAGEIRLSPHPRSAGHGGGGQCAGGRDRASFVRAAARRRTPVRRARGRRRPGRSRRLSGRRADR